MLVQFCKATKPPCLTLDELAEADAEAKTLPGQRARYGAVNKSRGDPNRNTIQAKDLRPLVPRWLKAAYYGLLSPAMRLNSARHRAIPLVLRRPRCTPRSGNDRLDRPSTLLIEARKPTAS